MKKVSEMKINSIQVIIVRSILVVVIIIHYW